MYVNCSECGTLLLGDDKADALNVVCNKCMSKVVKKARAYDGYTKAVKNGDIVVLSRGEVKKLVQDLPVGFGIRRFLEEHSNWKRDDNE